MPLLPTNLAVGTSGHVNHSNQVHGKLNDLPNIVRDYGCVGDNSTNNTTNLQTALDETADAAASFGRAGVLIVPPGVYKTDELAIQRGVVLLGLGQPGKGGDTRYGATLAARAVDQTLLRINADASIYQEGFACDSIGFYNGGFSGVTGVSVHGVNRWQLRNCTFNGITGTPMAVGLFCQADNQAGAQRDCAWWSVDSCDFRRCQIGAKISGNGGRVRGSDFVPDGAQTGEIGIWLRADADNGSQSNRISECMFDVCDSTTSYGVVIEGGDNTVADCKFEGIPPGTGDGNGIVMRKDAGGTNPIRNNILSSHFGGFGGTGNCITVGANVFDTGIFFNQFTSTTEISDSGTRTQNFHNRLSSATWT